MDPFARWSGVNDQSDGPGQQQGLSMERLEVSTKKALTGLEITSKDILICLGIIFGCFLSAKVVYRLFFSPLRHVPGPFIANVTSQWSIITSMSGNRARIVDRLHRKYGPVVRLGPSELSFSTPEAIDTIHNMNTVFNKAAIYDYLGEKSLFSIRDVPTHRKRRRLLNHAFSQHYLFDMEPEFRRSVKKITDFIEQSGGEPIDVKHWFKMYTLDNAGKAFLGASFGALDSEETPQIAKDYDVLFHIWAGEAIFPITMWVLKHIPHPKLKHLFGAHKRIYQYGADKLKEYVQKYGRVSNRKDLLTKMIGTKENDPDALPDKDIEAEIGGLCFAATDTASTTLIYLFWELGRNPDIAARIREELFDAPLVDGAVPYTSTIASRWLEATLLETLRKYPAGPSGLPRDTPRGGCVIDGVYVPEGTVVSTNTWTVHHDPEHFPDPYKFDPARWLGEVTPGMKARLVPFSKGQFNCIGQPMALFEMKILIATLVKKYHITTPDFMTPKVVDFEDYILAVPKCKKCLIRFTPI
ncbi:hypothetical protein VTO42DRAFT_3365 [Malbranchea cinnamomea]